MISIVFQAYHAPKIRPITDSQCPSSICQDPFPLTQKQYLFTENTILFSLSELLPLAIFILPLQCCCLYPHIKASFCICPLTSLSLDTIAGDLIKRCLLFSSLPTSVTQISALESSGMMKVCSEHLPSTELNSLQLHTEFFCCI